MMDIRRVTQKLLLKLYARAKSAGLLESAWTKAAFLGSYFAYKRYVEDPLGGFVASHPGLFVRGHILDVGANVGYTTALLCEVVRSPYRVVAFEPESANFELLQLVLARKRLADRVIAEQAAVGRESGQTPLWLNQAHHADHRICTDALRSQIEAAGPVSIETVRMVSVDDYVEEKDLQEVSFVKIDVQGYEAEVCAGLERTLERNPDAVVAFEHSPGQARELGFEPDAALRFFEERGYRLQRLARGQALAVLGRGDREHGGSRGYVDVVASRRALTPS